MNDDTKATCFALFFMALFALFLFANDHKQGLLNETDPTANR